MSEDLESLRRADDHPATITIKPPNVIEGPVEPVARTFTMWSVHVDSLDSEAGPRTSAPDRGAAAQSPPEPEGPMYRLVRQVGSGGMGEVFEAIQVSLDRVVAVKRLKRSRHSECTDNSAALFRTEAVIAARLEHPNIVPVHDLGADEEGSPLLAMKLIEGTPWDAALRTELSTSTWEDYLARHVDILIDVAQAVAFAHAQGIVHRDLKPAQVLLGGFGEVMLTDWGLAVCTEHGAQPRVAGSGLAAHLPTPATASSPAGTPALMAPEQTELSAKGIGPWTDVFLLGGTLYFVLTGTYPFSAETPIRAVTLAKECKYEPPSVRAPDRAIPAELEGICLACLKAVPSERTESALAFVRALQDYKNGSLQRRTSIKLTDEVAARLAAPDSSYASFTECASLLGQAASHWGANPAIRALQAAILAGHARAALRLGDLALARIQGERLDADSPERAAIIREVGVAEEAQAAQVRQRRLAIRVAASLMLVLALCATAFTVVFRNERDAARASQKRAELAEADSAEHLAESRTARAASDGLVTFMIDDLATRIAPLDPELKSLSEVTRRASDHFLEASENLDDATPEERWRVMTGLVNVGKTAGVQGNYEVAMKVETTAINIAESAKWIAEDKAHPWDQLVADAYAGRVATFQQTGDLDAALADGKKALARIDRALTECKDCEEAQLDQRQLFLQLAKVHDLRGEVTPAVEHARRAVAGARDHQSAHPESADARLELFSSVSELARLVNLTGNYDESKGLAIEAERIMNEGADAHDQSLEYQFSSANTLNVLSSTVAESADDVEEAIRLRSRSDKFFGELLRKAPHVQKYRKGAIQNRFALADALAHGGNAQDGLRVALEGVEWTQELVELSTGDLDSSMTLGQNYAWSGDIARQAKQTTQALELMNQGIGIMTECIEAQPSNLLWRQTVSTAYQQRGTLKSGMGEREAAVADYMLHQETIRRLLESDPKNIEWRRELSSGISNLAAMYAAAGETVLAEKHFQEMRSLAEEMLKDVGPAPFVLYQIAISNNRLGGLLWDLGRAAESAEAYLTCSRTLDELAKEVPGGANERFVRNSALVFAADILVLLNQGAEGGEHLEEVKRRYLADKEAGVMNETSFGQWMGKSMRITALVQIQVGDLDEARQSLDEAEQLLARCAEAGKDPRCLMEYGLVSALRARILESRGESDEALAMFAVARDRLTNAHPKPTHGQARFAAMELARAMFKLGDVEGGRAIAEHLSRAAIADPSFDELCAANGVTRPE